MLDLGKQSGRLLAVRGAAGLVFGAVAIALRSMPVRGLIVALSIYALLDGLMLLGAAIRRYVCGDAWALSFIEGALDVCFFVAVVWPLRSSTALWFATVAWAMATGFIAVLASVAAESPVRGPFVAEVGIASLMLGLWMLVWPKPAAVALAWTIGIYAMVAGGLLLGLAIQLLKPATPRLHHSS